MAAQRSDNVFLLTLVDFLLQIIFVGLFAYAIATSMSAKRQASLSTIETALRGWSEEQVQKLLATLAAAPDVGKTLKDQKDLKDFLGKQGVSNLAALTDKLSRMVPVDQVTDIKQVRQAITDAGGAENARLAISAYLHGVGKPHCLYASDKKSAFPLATITAFDDEIVFDTQTPELNLVLAQLGENYGTIAKLSLTDFTRRFAKIASLYPKCVHSLRVREKTEYVRARKAVSATQSFRLIFVP